MVRFTSSLGPYTIREYPQAIEIIDSFICLGDIVEVWSNDSTRSVENPDDGCSDAEVRWQISPPANVNLNEPDVVSLNNIEPLSCLTSNFDVNNDRLRFTPPRYWGLSFCFTIRKFLRHHNCGYINYLRGRYP